MIEVYWRRTQVSLKVGVISSRHMGREMGVGREAAAATLREEGEGN